MGTDAISPLRQRMIEDMSARQLHPLTQRGHIRACKRFAAFLKRSPDTATSDDLRRFQLHLAESGVSICNRNRTVTALRFLFRVTLRRLDLLTELYHIKEPEKVPLVMSQDETKRLLAVAANLKVRLLLSLAYGAGLRVGEVVRLKVKHIDKAQMIIRIEQSKGRKDRLVMLSPETLALLREWWKVRTTRYDQGVPVQERWLFPGRRPGLHLTERQVYTLPAQLRDIAYHNKRVIYHLLMKASAEATLTIAADPKHLGARTGIIAVLHTWGSALAHHPHVHMIVPGGGLSEGGARWVFSRPSFLVHVNVLSRLFRGRFLTMLVKAHAQGRLKFFGDHAALADRRAFKRFLAPLRKSQWVVHTKNPFAGPEQVLRYLSRYTHRVAISNRRLVSVDDNGVAFRWNDYRIDGPERWKTMTLTAHEFIRRFLMHVLPKGFHRIRHYGLFASSNRAANIARARELLGAAPRVAEEKKAAAPDEPRVLPCPCPRCGGRMIVIEVFARGCEPTYRPTPAPTPIRIDTS